MKESAHAYLFPTLPAPLRFAVALTPIAVVGAIVYAAGARVDDGSRFLSLGMAVITTGWFAGTGPALAATMLGAVLGGIEGRDAPGTGAAASMHLALFIGQGLLLTAVVSKLRAARLAAERQASDAQAARREGEATNRIKDEFLATISRELRTPLNAVIGWVHLLRMGRLDPSTSTRGLESIERNVRLQAQVTADLLDVSKALTGTLHLDSRPTGLVDAVRQALTAVRSSADAKGVTLNAVIPEGQVFVLGDPTRLRQIAWHLLANAIKFTPRGGTVELRLDASASEACVTITDSGCGIDPRFLPRIFGRFTQADSSATRAAGGLGVGLALVRELVELHGGEIEAHNRPGGGGAVFETRFPLRPAESLTRAPHAPEPSPASRASPLLDGVRVLVLDQDQDGRELLRTLLEQQGATVQAVDSVGEALESLEGWRPDVLVSETGSPAHNSYALVGKVRSLEADRGGRIPALALTTFARTDQRFAQLLANVHRDLPKPVEPALLATEIARLTGRERRHARR